MSAALPFEPQSVLAFWQQAGPSAWFRKDDAFDARFREDFLETHEAAAHGDLDDWVATADGALALLILLDQFPRNAFRGSARAFATDAKAREIAHASLAAGYDQQVSEDLRQFFYLPFMHSEDAADQALCVQLCEPLGEESAKFARLHRDIIQRFGRFPHRNAVLGRPTTPEEQRFLDEGGFAG